MADVKWIKITTDIFDDEKISLIDGMPERDGIIVIWFKLLCMAGKLNNGGVFMLNDKIAYTDEMLATIFRRPLSTVRLALKTFEQFGMVDIINNAYIIPNWEKHQSLGKMEAAKEKNRQRVAAHREKQKQLAQCNDYSNVTVTPCNALDKDKEEDRDKDKEKEKTILPGAETAPSQPAPAVQSSPVVISILLNDKTEYQITQADVDSWKELYPAVDVMQELRKMKGWADANPTKRKTKQGIKRFINSWLSKEQDRYHGPVDNRPQNYQGNVGQRTAPRQQPNQHREKSFMDIVREMENNGGDML